MPPESTVPGVPRSKGGGALPLLRFRDRPMPALPGPRTYHVPPAVGPAPGREWSERPMSAPPPADTAGPAVPRPKRRLARPVAALGVLALGAAAVFGALATGGRSTPRRPLPRTGTTQPDVSRAS